MDEDSSDWDPLATSSDGDSIDFPVTDDRVQLPPFKISEPSRLAPLPSSSSPENRPTNASHGNSQSDT